MQKIIVYLIFATTSIKMKFLFAFVVLIQLVVLILGQRTGFGGGNVDPYRYQGKLYSIV